MTSSYVTVANSVNLLNIIYHAVVSVPAGTGLVSYGGTESLVILQLVSFSAVAKLLKIKQSILIEKP